MGQPNSIPYEVIAAPFTLWVAPVGTAFPLVDEDPPAPWVQVGTSGNLNYMEEGVTVSHPQTVTPWRSLGDTAPRKYFRTEEDLSIRLVLADVTLEQYSHAINANAVVTTAQGVGTPAYKTMGLSRGSNVSQKALLLRGPSPYGNDWAAQYEVPVAFAGGSPEIVYANSGVPAGLELEFMAVVDPDAASASERFGRLVAQTDDAGT